MRPVKITAQCKIVTPMLSSGENQQEFEIRATEVKSGLRFWWRAFQPCDGKELFDKEKVLFGSTEGTSPFSLYVSYKDQSIQKYMIGNPHGWGDGIQYCLFAINKPKQKSGQPAQIKTAGQGGRPLAKPGGEFSINFVFKNNADEKIISDILCSLWLLENFGGLGGRTRRGAGCFEIFGLKIEADDAVLDSDLLTGLFDRRQYDKPEQFIRYGLDSILSEWFGEETHYPLPAHTAFRPGISEIRVFRGPKADKCKGSGAMQAMDAIGTGMKNFRHVNPYEEAKQMHHALSGEGGLPTFTVLEKAQMGLPIIYNFRDRGMFDKYGPPKGGKYEAKGVIWERGKPLTDSKENANRRASPLMISCHQFKGMPYAVLCHFPAPILPDGQKIWLKSQKPSGRDYFPDPPDTYEYTDDLLINGRYVKGKLREPISKYFHHHEIICQRKSDGNCNLTDANKVLTEIPEKKQADQRKAVSPPIQAPPDIDLDDPNAMKIAQISQAPSRKDGLQCFLAEICGPLQGNKKKQQWPCNLWYMKEGVLHKDPDKWYIRKKNLEKGLGLKGVTGELFLCTIQPDANTKSENNFLYNAIKP